MDLEKIRTEIDKIDGQLLELLQERFKLMPSVAKYKKENNLAIFDQTRENEILKNKSELAENYGLDTEFTKNFFHLVMDHSKEIQEKIIKEKND